MRESHVCRRCVSQSLVPGGGRRAFAIPGAEPHYAPDRPFRPEHLALDLEVSPREGWLKGRAKHRVRAVAPGQTRVLFEQAGLTITGAAVDGKPAPFEIDGQKLWVKLSAPATEGTALEVSFDYSLSRPRRGIYFTGPDADYPRKPYQVWTQGQDEDSRFWFPSFDHPSVKATSEVRVRVPQGFTAISNGALVERKPEGPVTVFHYKLGTPHVSYLVTLVVGEFDEWKDTGPHGLPVEYFVEKGRKADGERSFSHTPRMIEAFEAATGVQYPYEKYSQAAVQDFIFGGMENTSATTQTDVTLHDARAHLDFSSDPLVAHELAHQWFGNLLTCRDWSHAWLNEGFATFMERVWIEANTGEFPDANVRRDEAQYYQSLDLAEYLAEDGGSYRRPIVCNTYREPIDLFDAHLYQKGGLVLNCLRAELGEEAFWKAIRLYVSRHRGSSVETLDLVRAIEDATGRNLRRFFDQWVFSGGHPELEASYAWHEDRKQIEISVEQKQSTADGTPLFQLTLGLEVVDSEGKTAFHKVDVREAKSRVFIAVGGKPKRVRLDPGSVVPKTLKFPRPKDLLLNQLTDDSDCLGRIEAAAELARVADAEITQKLGSALLNEKFWGAQVEIAKALSEIRTSAARDALIAGLRVQNPKARRGVVRALGTYPNDAAAASALDVLADSDPSYFVEAEASLSLAQVAPESQASAVERRLIQQLEKPSYRDTIRATSYAGLAKLPGVERGERPKALDAIIEGTRRGRPDFARLGAISALGSIVSRATPEIRARGFDVLSKLVDEDSFRVHMTLVGALSQASHPRSAHELDRLEVLDADARVKRLAYVMADSVRQSGGTPSAFGALQESFRKLEEDYRKLKGEIEDLRAVATQKQLNR